MADDDGGAPELPQHDANGRQKSAAFELFILGELMDAPHHGYLLRDILARMLGPYRQISWAAIYPLIHRLEHAACIAPAPVAEPGQRDSARNSRQRRPFGITASGRQRFFALMLAPGEFNADYRELFTIKLLYLGFLTPEQQQSILEECQDYLERQCRHLRHVFTADSTTAHLAPAAREQIFRMMRFRLVSAEAELQYVAGELARLREARA